MIIIDYIFYSIYCAATTFRKKQGGHARALSMFSFALTFIVTGITNIAGLTPILKNWSVYYPAAILGLCFLLSGFYFNTNDKKENIVVRFNEKTGEWERIYALIGLIYFFSSVFFFAFTVRYFD